MTSKTPTEEAAKEEAVECGARALFCHQEDLPLAAALEPSVVFTFTTADPETRDIANWLRAKARAVIEGSGLLSELARLQAERDRAVEALGPFAATGAVLDAKPKDNAVWAGQRPAAPLTFGDFRRAAEVVSTLPPPVKEAEPEPVAVDWSRDPETGLSRVTTPPALQARVEALKGATRDLRDRLLAFVGAVAEITDCSADVDAINRADALLDRAALTGEKG